MDEVSKTLPRNFASIPDGPQVLFLSYKQYLQMLDFSIPDGDYFFDKDTVAVAVAPIPSLSSCSVSVFVVVGIPIEIDGALV